MICQHDAYCVCKETIIFHILCILPTFAVSNLLTLKRLFLQIQPQKLDRNYFQDRDEEGEGRMA